MTRKQYTWLRKVPGRAESAKSAEALSTRLGFSSVGEWKPQGSNNDGPIWAKCRYGDVNAEVWVIPRSSAGLYLCIPKGQLVASLSWYTNGWFLREYNIHRVLRSL